MSLDNYAIDLSSMYIDFRHKVRTAFLNVVYQLNAIFMLFSKIYFNNMYFRSMLHGMTVCDYNLINNQLKNKKVQITIN